MEIEIKPKGNSMTQKFYTKCVLPKHIDHIKHLEQKYSRNVLFQEDNDGSHRTSSFNNPPTQLKRERSIKLLFHPAQSLDLNPQESIWQIIKARLRGEH